MANPDLTQIRITGRAGAVDLPSCTEIGVFCILVVL